MAGSEGVFKKSLFQFRPNVIVCGSHHAVQMSGMEVPKHVDLSSVQIVAPMGAAVHLTIVDDLKARFPSMMPVQD
jgi:hypothetical protein